MSLSIDVDKVTAVYVAGDWHQVADASFDLDSYEYRHGDHWLVKGGTVEGVPSTGFSFRTYEGESMVGPITAIEAVRLS